MKQSNAISFCTGCGACVSAGNATLIMNDNGFFVANPSNDKFDKFCSNVCFSAGNQYRNSSNASVWGDVLSSKYAWSSNAEIRHLASSGGTLTALCLYLLESGKVDGIVHTMEDPCNPIGTITVCSTTSNEIISRSGSRYSSSSPLKDIYSYLGDGKKYCYVGKPCDVATMRNLMSSDHRFKDTFVVLLSFFCAGAPSAKANETLLKKMGTDVNHCKSLRYRGDGWPGYATAIDDNGRKYTLNYRTAWRDTLGRDIRLICRFCMDGIGEMADIVCYDAWYMNVQLEPVFDEAEGRNGVMCRSELGVEIFNNAVNNGYLIASDYPNYDMELSHYQKYQYTRRTTMASTLLAMKVMFRSTPDYPFKVIFRQMMQGDLKRQVSRFVGTIKRIILKKI